MNGISLFTGNGGIDLSLKDYVRTILYCEKDEYAQAIILSRMLEGSLEFAPVWTDVTTMDGYKFRDLADLIKGGFPCQGNSTAGNGRGLADERTGLFHQIVRIAEEAQPTFIFLENVEGIRAKESYVVKRELARIGYDCRWGVISASSVGANHQRKRYFCLAAHSDRIKLRDEHWWGRWTSWKSKAVTGDNGEEELMARPISDGHRYRFFEYSQTPEKEDYQGVGKSYGWPMSSITKCDWWSSKPRIHRVDDGTPHRLDRVKSCGNGVVPLQVKTAFEMLLGIK